MTDRPGPYSWKNPWFSRSVLAVVATTIVSLLIGFVWLPSRQGDFGADGLWASICRAAGVPQRWGGPSTPSPVAMRTTAVVLTRSMAKVGDDEAIGLGATIALQCTTCHGVRGVTGTDAPNLAGQYPEVIAKQLDDYRNGDRINSVMQAYAKGLKAADVREVAAYYAYLPRASSSSSTGTGAPEPRLVRVGDPMRNIAACAACHGADDHKLGTPRLEAMPKAYLVEQLTAFAAGTRHNDSHAQMRNMARRLTPAEVDALATWYARR